MKNMFDALHDAGAPGAALLLRALVSGDERRDWHALFRPPVVSSAEMKLMLGAELGSGTFLSAHTDRNKPTARVIGRAHETFDGDTCKNDDDESWNLEHMVTSIRAGIRFYRGNGGEPSPHVVAVEGFTFAVHKDGSARFLLMLRRYDFNLRHSPLPERAGGDYALAAKMCFSLLRSAVAVRNEGIVQNDSSPANVGVTETDGEAGAEVSVHFSDFGSAKELGKPSTPVNYKNPCYMSPEELEASMKFKKYNMDDAAVSWSVGYLLLFILRGGESLFKERPPATLPGTKEGEVDRLWRMQVAAEHAEFAASYDALVHDAQLPGKGGNAWTQAALMLMNPDKTKRKRIDVVWSMVAAAHPPPSAEEKIADNI